MKALKWCPECRSYHVTPKSKEHHKRLGCFCTYSLNIQEVAKKWGRYIRKKGVKLDPDYEREWFSLWIGYALGHGISMSKATNYSFYMDHVFPYEEKA